MTVDMSIKIYPWSHVPPLMTFVAASLTKVYKKKNNKRVKCQDNNNNEYVKENLLRNR
jgi:hypothetical protein